MTDLLCLNSIRGKSGKDTLIGLLESEGRKVFRVAFADILKKQCAAELAFTDTQAANLEAGMHSSSKDHSVQSLSISNIPRGAYYRWLVGQEEHGLWAERSLRWHLQQYGTEYRREFCKEPNVWLDLGMSEVRKGFDSGVDHVVVTDLRLPNEYKEVLYAPEVKTIRIVRDWFIPGVDEQPYHISDIALMAHPFDALVVNRLGEPWAMLDQLKEQGVIK